MARNVPTPRTVAAVEQRVDAIQSVLDEHGMRPGEFIVQANHLVEEEWVPENGARIVAKAWTDAAFRARYGSSKYLDGMLSARASAATLRIRPAE